MLKEIDRKLCPISGDGNCLFRALALIIYGSESFHDRVRLLLTNFIEKNTKDFKKYLSDETMETHLKKLKQLGQWGGQVELKAAAGILKLPTYIYTPSLKADGQNAWNKVIPSIANEIPNVPLNDMNHVELCHTKGMRYDAIVLRNDTYPKNFPDYTMCM